MDTNSLLSIVLIVVAVYIVKNYILSSAVPPPKPSAKSSAARAKAAKDAPKKYYTAEEVSVHDKEDDLWLIIDGKVYDVTPYVDKHMGGLAIMRNAGKDSSKGFHGDQHPVKVAQILEDFYIGELKV
ncbi:hypothetical protein SAMD00019534_065590 [Acytostelium subglobosum LB1]|uniref:hypothetical protein n=1 Tax=Acytostelium subglobosum LB1 TaxID=1410327 RepID=UPI0006448B04|nr:hypothetical protein SAMD00019534_065590 [Acytostelium subglobosum LB1]GAM23384.1 hypothetical protein SAMD00019534_065590 [Acytostelium subglobosum LB1]|eukprot:XP_012753833.1 hypothetical protein SAMD00019534_065590 [Acytostelium subglobosum LB1]